MKAHIGVDADSGLVHTLTATPASAHDITEAHELLHDNEEDVFADSGYRGVHKRQEVKGTHPDINWHVAMMPGNRRRLDVVRDMDCLTDELEYVKARIRSKVEHPFRVIKRQFVDGAQEVTAMRRIGASAIGPSSLNRMPHSQIESPSATAVSYLTQLAARQN